MVGRALEKKAMMRRALGKTSTHFAISALVRGRGCVEIVFRVFTRVSESVEGVGFLPWL
ncbi:hypothetical protein HMPREF9004_0506 [Schaalia cardiffensis F0333]|uniref:Uncharacterized protein n=1 Tax=Schaalia cardiffensis F0333 TaxID=888050 RepID=N6X539_9ACTO|nr:hypothetical protein HMPREF9004_0506 [Schaalia cardiffensis F0333]